MTLLTTDDTLQLVRASLRQLRSIPDKLVDHEGYQHFVADGVISPSVKNLSKNELRSVILQSIPAASTFSGTFYKDWQTVVSMSVDLQYENAIKHYVSTYGVEAVFGRDTNAEDNLLHLPQGFIPEQLSEHPKLFDLFVVRISTKQELETLLQNTIYKGMALKQQTIKDYLLLASFYGISICIDCVKNKETRTYLQAGMNIVPNDPDEAIRLLSYVSTGDTTLIQDERHIMTIRYGFNWTDQNKALAEKILNEGQVQLASVFYRYKKLFLALKRCGFNKQVNRIRRMANRFWTPKPEENDFLTSKILSDEEVVLFTDLAKYDTETLVKVYNKLAYIAQAYREQGDYQEIYTIRNGKYFVKTKPKTLTAFQYNMVTTARDNLLEVLRERLNPEGYSIVVPKGIDLAFPTSEKSFIGEVPLYSQIKLQEAASTVGISWAKDDIDLSGLTRDGKKVGWNAYYNNSGMLYSGDCTRGGAEAIYLTENNRVMIMVNLFNTGKNELNLFFSTQDRNKFEMLRGSAYEPTDVVYSTQLNLENRSQMLGVYDKEETGTFTFANLSHGESNVCSASELTTVMTDVLVMRGKTALKVTDIFPERTDETKYLSLGSDEILDKSKILALAGDYSALLIEEEEQ